MNRFRERFVLMALCALSAAAIAACDAPEPAAPPAAPPAAEPAMPARSYMPPPAEASGVYAMHGVTVRASEGALREIDGIIRLLVEGDTFSVTCELNTIFSEGDLSFPATVVGWGRGVIVGDTLAGTLSNTVARRNVEEQPPTNRLPVEEIVVMSSAVARFTPNGGLQVELQNHPGIDQPYSPSVTVIEGKRIRPLNPKS